ncbi:PIG-L deacetylase family protein [Porphyromonas endodontalis]|uniref:PIG-L deacetylase family protein n=1 Tax=Porphyromonas endodontalis TaxID=28124 RepID=UPI0028E1C7AC|nr:PIG-L deacetylase family protein [Porphyromonas endodontalis]
MKRILVVAPHADDEILGCGATIAKVVAEGGSAFVAIMTNAHVGDPEMFQEARIKNVREEALRAHKMLNVSETFFFDFPAPRLDTYPAYKISFALSKLIADIKPDTLFIPSLGDLHVDHLCLYRACLVAGRPINDTSIKNILTYETLSETNWAPLQGNQTFIPNVFIDTSAYFEKKLEAAKCFSSQMRDFPYCRSLTALEALGKIRGSNIGVHYAEAFSLERAIL